MSSDDPSAAEPAATETAAIRITYRGEAHSYTLAASGTLADLAAAIEADLGPAAATQKFLIPGKGLLKHPLPATPTLGALPLDKKIQVLAPTAQELAGLSAGTSALSARQRPSPIAAARPGRKAGGVATLTGRGGAGYTFHRIVPLGYLPDPGRSARFLERLRDDPGIRAAMAAHRFSVGTLTEMDPAQHTTHESRTLGLNRNGGEVIELRLRTDAFDGYRDYRTIRNTLCHELAHNVHGPHDRSFWDLCHQIEREVERADWTRGGHRLTDDEFYNPDDDGVQGHVDAGGWTGGSFVLGAGPAAAGTAAAEAGNEAPQDARAARARAAEDRLRRQREQRSPPGGGES